MRDLLIHPDFRCGAISGLAVEVERPEPKRLRLHYRLGGVTAGLVMPPATAGRADDLWKHTCFEAFVRVPEAAGYRELNFAAGQWAAYRFDGYRAGMANAEIGPPGADLAGSGGGGFDILLTWDLDLPGEATWEVGVTAVIEEADRGLSYWSLRHPPGKPDFHHADGFALEVPAPSRP